MRGIQQAINKRTGKAEDHMNMGTGDTRNRPSEEQGSEEQGDRGTEDERQRIRRTGHKGTGR